MRRAALYGFCATVFALGLLFGAARVTASSAARSLELAWTPLKDVSAQGLSTDEGLRVLREARSRVERAEATVSRFDVRAVAALPLIGRSLDAERNVISAALTALAAAEAAAEGLPALRPTTDGRVDLSALAELRDRLEQPVARAERAFARLETTSTSLTPSIVARGVEQAEAALGPAVEGLVQAHRALDVMEGLLGGSGARSLLVMIENNAELRGTGGYTASFATGTLEDGALDLGPLREVEAVAHAPEVAVRVPAPPEFVEDFGPLSGDTTIWRSWNMSPDVPQSAQVGAEVAGVLLGTKPDVVLLLDVPAMSALAALGDRGVRLPDGETVSADELTEALLVDAYAEAGPDAGAQQDRREALLAAATASVTRLLGSEAEPLNTVRTLGRLVDGRHLKVWSAHPDEQRQLELLRAAGRLSAPPQADLVHVSVNNVGANKLDVHVDREVDVDVVVDVDRAQVVQRVRFSNDAPDDLVPYVAGRDRPGTVVSRVELSLPVSARVTAATVGGVPWPELPRRGADRQRLATRIEMARGESVELEVRYDLPLRLGAYQVTLVPQPLASPSTLALSIRPARGERLLVVDGVELSDGTAQESSAFAATREVSAGVIGTGWWPRLRAKVEQFWSSPVEVG